MSEDRQPQTEDTTSSSAINFVSFVLSLAHTAAVHFGDVADPVTGARAETDLASAQQMIDILSLIEEKTRGNLTAEERQLIEQVLYELRLRFVESTNKGAAPATEQKSRIIIP